MLSRYVVIKHVDRDEFKEIYKSHLFLQKCKHFVINLSDSAAMFKFF